MEHLFALCESSGGQRQTSGRQDFTKQTTCYHMPSVLEAPSRTLPGDGACTPIAYVDMARRQTFWRVQCRAMGMSQMTLRFRRPNVPPHLVSTIENRDGLGDLTHCSRELAQYEPFEGST